MTRIRTLSQNFDIGDFIPPDILSVVDAGVRAAAVDIIQREGLKGDLERIVDLRAESFSISDMSIGGLVPSMDPDEFMPYEKPNMPVMTWFDEFTAAAAPQKSGAAPELLVSTAFSHEESDNALAAAGFDPVDIDVKITDLASIEETTAKIQEGMAIEIPEVSNFNANLFKVKMDTLRFDRKFLKRVYLVIVIAFIAVVELLLIIYLLSQ